MSSTKKKSIFLYTGYTPRATALKNRVDKATDGAARITLIDTERSITEKKDGDSDSIVILDLPNIKQPAIHTINKVKDCVATSKILAIHIYTSRLLIDPLLEAGIHGYLTYEPEPNHLRSAFKVVLNDGLYLPPEIYHP